MKNLIVIAVAFLFSMTNLVAQNINNPKVQEMRKKFYTEKLQLTADENEKFWPVFDKYQAAEKQLRKKYKPNADTTPMNDDQIEQHLKNVQEYEEKKTDLKKQFTNNDFKKVLPVRKVAMLDQVERQFKKTLLNKVKQRRQSGSKK